MTTRRIPLTPDLAAALDAQQHAFRTKFGREPGPDDPLFFDPDADTPQPLKSREIAPDPSAGPRIITAVSLTLGVQDTRKARLKQAARLLKDHLALPEAPKPFRVFEDRATFWVTHTARLSDAALMETVKALAHAQGGTFAELWCTDDEGALTYSCDRGQMPTVSRT